MFSAFKNGLYSHLLSLSLLYTNIPFILFFVNKASDAKWHAFNSMLIPRAITIKQACHNMQTNREDTSRNYHLKIHYQWRTICFIISLKFITKQSLSLFDLHSRTTGTTGQTRQKGKEGRQWRTRSTGKLFFNFKSVKSIFDPTLAHDSSCPCQENKKHY